MMQLVPWTRKHRSELVRWPAESNVDLPLFLLPSKSEPVSYAKSSLAVLVGGSLVGRFTYRVCSPLSVFVGLVLDPSVRGFGYAVPAVRAGLVCLAGLGYALAYASVALANLPSVRMLRGAGFAPYCCEWRVLPNGTDESFFLSCPIGTYRLVPAPALAYSMQAVALDVSMYAEVA
jgi:hypothetical protein